MRGAGWVFGSVSALPIVFGVPNVLRTFTEITQSTQAVTAISFLLFFMLLYAVIIAPLARIKIFKGDHGVTKPGKIAAVAIALLATVGIFYGYGGKAPAALFNILAPFGVFGGLVLALVIFLLIFMGFRESGTGSAFPIALTTAALAMILAGALLSEPNISAIGWIIAGIAVIVFLIMMVISAVRGSATSAQPPGSPPAPSAPVQSPVPRQSIPGRRSTVPPIQAPTPRAPTPVQGPPASAPSSTTLPPARVPATAPPPPSPAVHPSTLRSALDHLSSLAGYTSTLHNSGLQFPEDRTFEYSDQQEATAQLQRATNVRTILDHIVSDLSALRGMRKALPVPFAQLLERSAGIMIPELRKLLDDVQLVIDRYVRHVPVPGHVTAADLNRQRRHVQDLFTEFLTQAQTMFGQQISVRAPSLPAAQRVSPQKTIQNMTLTEITAQLDPACTMEGGPFEAYAEVISTKNAGNLIEDAAHADGKIGLILVADGVGGHPAGNVATRAARNAILHFLRANYAQLLRADHDARRTMLNAAVQEGANMIRALIASNSHFTNTDPSTNRTLTMATTLSIGILLPAEGRYFVYGANIGDSRMYVRKKSGEMQQVSSDDGVAANEVRAGRITPDQAEVHPQRHVVTAVLGDQTPAQLEVHQLFNIPVETGDMVVAMSDGVIDNLGKKFIDAVGAAYGAPKEIVHGLLTEAHRIAKNPTDDYERSHAKDDDIAAAAILVPASHPHMSAAAALRPVLGFWKVPAAQTGFVVKEGLQVGYTELDTSDNYDNEEQLAAALHALHATVDVVYTKIDPSHYHEISVRVERAQQLFDGVTRELILMLHWPGPFTRPDGQVVFDAIDGMAAYKALAALVDKPSVSNFGISHLVAILPIKKPYLNQIEINPLLQQSDLIAFCKKYGILVQAYSPLASGKLNGHPVLVSIVNKHRKSEAQILIRYAFQKGADIVNVKSADPVRMRGNLDINDFQLDSGDMAQLDGLGDDAAYPFGTSGNAPAPQVFHPLRTS